ncbi:phosphate ABC transporter substrate-binding protein [Cellvibrio sp. pealriver]|uniref:phosphate ABC transporter substrate-binding protein n=1 Tax=Cellvibrio sp. pealriver TaxID=1622269 RepID=UPI00066FDFC1|nr:phosphate ABC transporter substrate-binding protein [Cellvibrio sp. pealriver]
MKKIITSFAATLALCVSAISWAEVAVIVHPSAGFDSLTEDDVSRIFLGKSKSFPGGAQAVPVNQNEGSAARDKFNESVCKKNASQYKAYWSQLVFTGKGTPPKDAGDDGAVKALVAANPNMIGYVDSSAVDASVKVVFKVP